MTRRIRAVLAEATLEPPADQRPILGGRRGHHSEHLGHLLAVMQYPAAHLSGRDMVSGDVTRRPESRALHSRGRLDESGSAGAGGSVPDPEIPVVSVVDLGIVRDVSAGAGD